MYLVAAEGKKVLQLLYFCGTFLVILVSIVQDSVDVISRGN